MKRTGMGPRKRAMKRGDISQRRGGVWPARPPIKRKPKSSKLWEAQYHSGAFVTFTRMSPSSASGERGPCVFSHSAKSKGAGGTYRDGLPLTDAEHKLEHMLGVRTFWARYGKDPKVEAREHWKRFVTFTEAMGGTL